MKPRPPERWSPLSPVRWMFVLVSFWTRLLGRKWLLLALAGSTILAVILNYKF